MAVSVYHETILLLSIISAWFGGQFFFFSEELLLLFWQVWIDLMWKKKKNNVLIVIYFQLSYTEVFIQWAGPLKFDYFVMSSEWHPNRRCDVYRLSVFTIQRTMNLSWSKSDTVNSWYFCLLQTNLKLVYRRLIFILSMENTDRYDLMFPDENYGLKCF